jgi:glycosyltransferase involved in cell wall biosynthesis
VTGGGASRAPGSGREGGADDSGLVFFGHRPWGDIEAFGFRKTSGAMFRCLRENGRFGTLHYVQMDRRWGARVTRHRVDADCDVIGLPVGLPYGRVPAVRRLNRALQAALLRRTLTRIGPAVPEVVWFYDWAPIEIVERLPRRLTVMEVTDAPELVYATLPAALAGFVGFRRAALASADLILAVAPRLAHGLTPDRAQVAVLPNGIAAEFLAAAAAAWPEPAALAGVARPRLCVVVGEWSANHRLHHDLLGAALDELPGWTLVLVGVGAVRTAGLERLLSRDRVAVVPPVPQTSLVPIIRHCDVCAVPYDPPGGFGDALKTYEYLACGRPVVVNLDDVEPALERFIARARTAKEFAARCVELAARGGLDLDEVHGALAGFTWERRAARALALLDEVRDERRRAAGDD